jgi:AraC-like DNA-binding protein
MRVLVQATLKGLGVGIMVGVAPFTIHHGYATYRGPIPAGAAHSHAAFQIVMAPSGEVTILDAAGVPHHAPALLVTPMTRHQLLATPDALTFFIDPQSALADRLRAQSSPPLTSPPPTSPPLTSPPLTSPPLTSSPLTSSPPPMNADSPPSAPHAGVAVLHDLRPDDIRRQAALASPALDRRLVAAMALPHLAIPEVAARVGLSPQRLRAVARAELGLPLARWRIWARLQRAAEALQDGRPLAEAAVTAGFADQSHLTRWMREMMGLTPSEVLPALRNHPGPAAQPYPPRSFPAGGVDRDGPGDGRHDFGLAHVVEAGLGDQSR